MEFKGDLVMMLCEGLLMTFSADTEAQDGLFVAVVARARKT